MKNYYVYLLKCSDDSLYIGVTNNPERRVDEHNEGMDATSYTHNKRPVTLLRSFLFTDINVAISFEKQIKRWSRRKKLALIREDWDLIHEFSKRYSPNKPKNNSVMVRVPSP